MASRIVIVERLALPYASIGLDAPVLIRLWADDPEVFRPIIAKGNRIDGIEAVV